MAKMLARAHKRPSCCARDDDFLHAHTQRRRIQRHREQQGLDSEFAAAASWYDSTEGKRWLERGLAEAEGWPYWDFSDCQHGCNGSPCGSERCTFICHEKPGDGGDR